MKSLSKIFARYLMTAAAIILVTLFLNLVLYIFLAFDIIQSGNYWSNNSRAISEEFTLENGSPQLSRTGYEYLTQEEYSWAMLLDDSGHIIWEWQLPDNLRRDYTARDIARFSKWYLDDYPVVERLNDCGLLVIAKPPGTVWKYNVSDSTYRVKKSIQMIPITLGLNLLFVFILSLLMGYIFYRSLRGIAVGIEQLSKHQPIHLPEKGMTEMLARQLNLTSDTLTRQQAQLKRRDDARTTWISGVSHDIRTPLSLIMGHANAMKEDASLTDEQRRQAEIIEQQSLQIKHLIEDLNLVSKLEYAMQPLRVVDFPPSRLLRQIVTDFYNQGLSENHLIDLYIDPDVEQMILKGDTSLLTRALRNLIQNSIRHNPKGCTVTLTAYPRDDEEGVCFQVSDDGCGIPKNVILSLTGDLPDTEKAPHIMGLKIVWQIFRAHGWEMIFKDTQTIYILCKANTPPRAKIRGVDCPTEKPTSKAAQKN